jgi:hypothetical protein
MIIWYVLCSFGTFCFHFVHFFPVLLLCTTKNLATLLPPSEISQNCAKIKTGTGLLAWAGLRFGSAGSPIDFDNQGDQMSS